PQSRSSCSRARDMLSVDTCFSSSVPSPALRDLLSFPTRRSSDLLGGTMAIGCDTEAVKKCPTSFEELLGSEYKGKVAMRGNPTTGEAGFMAVFAASLANGGSLGDIEPGIDYFKQLSDKGNLVPTEAEAGTIETGETPIVVNWDYLLLQWADDLSDSGIDLSVDVPSDGTVASYYAASLNEDAPHPAV